MSCTYWPYASADQFYEPGDKRPKPKKPKHDDFCSVCGGYCSETESCRCGDCATRPIPESAKKGKKP